MWCKQTKYINVVPLQVLSLDYVLFTPRTDHLSMYLSIYLSPLDNGVDFSGKDLRGLTAHVTGWEGAVRSATIQHMFLGLDLNSLWTDPAQLLRTADTGSTVCR